MRSKTRTVLLLATAIVGLAGSAGAETLVYCPFDSLDGWTVRSSGAETAEVVADPPTARCVELTSSGGTVLLTRDLSVEAVAGTRVSIGCRVKTADVVRGPQLSDTAKVHLAVETPSGVRYFSARFTGTGEWRREGLTADVPKDARRIVLDLGLESCAGRMWLAELTVRNDRRAVHIIPLARAANAEHGQLGLTAFPKGTLQWKGIPFQILDSAANESGDCFRLRGIGHEDWPAALAGPIPVGTHVSAVYILHGALDGRERCETPCAIWTARLSSGNDDNLSIFEGREIGAVGGATDLENWKVAWRGQDETGRPVSFGVTKWTINSDAPVLWLTCRAYRGASPVVLAVTVVEEPPRPEVESRDTEQEGQGG